MYIEGLDAQDNRIIEVIKKNARLSYSDIGKMVGLSRVAVRNRMEAMEQKGIIQGYQTMVRADRIPEGIKFVIDVEVSTDAFAEVLDALCNDKLIRQVYSTTGNCRLHCQGYAPNNQTLDAHVRYLYNHNAGIRRLDWHMLMTTYKDIDGGVEYVRYQESEHLERQRGE